MNQRNYNVQQNGLPREPEKQTGISWKTVVACVVACVAVLALLLALSVAVWWSVAGVKTFDEGMQLVKGVFMKKEEPSDTQTTAPTTPTAPQTTPTIIGTSYSVDAQEAMNKRGQTVATVGEHQLTNGVLQVYYWMNVYEFLENYGYYAAMMGLDYSKPLDQQKYSDEVGSWQEFFLEEALNGWHAYQAMSILAQQEGITLSEDMQESLDTLEKNLIEAAEEGKFPSVDAMLQKDMGPGCTFEDYYQYTKTYYEGYMYYSSLFEKIDSSQEAIDAYFAEKEEELKKSGITKESGNNFDVRHILIEVEGTKGADGKTTYSDEDWEECRDKAQKLLDEWLAGEHTEETFAEYAKKHSADGGSKDKGGLYTGLDKNTSFVKEFVDWYMDETRQVGDYGLIKTSYGYHIMYLSKIEAKWVAACRQGLLSDAYTEILEKAVKEYPMELNKENIVLGTVKLG